MQIASAASLSACWEPSAELLWAEYKKVERKLRVFGNRSFHTA